MVALQSGDLSLASGGHLHIVSGLGRFRVCGRDCFSGLAVAFSRGDGPARARARAGRERASHCTGPTPRRATMASPALQSQANALNARMEGEAKTAIDGIEREMLRPLAQKSYECIVNCYKKAGSTGSNEQLEHCTRSCQVVHQQAHGILQQVGGRIDDMASVLRCFWPIEPDMHACTHVRVCCDYR